MSALSPVTGILSSVAGIPVKAAANVALSTVSSWVVASSETVLGEVVKVIGLVTTPSLSISWFSASYWRISALAMLLTVPFLFAAAVQAVVRTDLGLLIRAALFDLPIAAISVTLAAPMITLALAATDEMCALVTGGGPVGGSFFTTAASNLSHAEGGFMTMVIALVILLAGLVLMVELIIRAAAIYIIVLFLPLGFAAMVWPARRVWLRRMLETLAALILSKFAMVAILALAVAGLGTVSTDPSTSALTVMALLVLAAFSPLALLRLLPLTELAAGAGAMLHHETSRGLHHGRVVGSNAAGLMAGALVDPLTDGVDGFRRFASNPAGAAPGSRSQSGTSQLAVLRSGDPSALTPAPGARSSSAPFVPRGGGGPDGGGGPGGDGPGARGPGGTGEPGLSGSGSSHAGSEMSSNEPAKGPVEDLSPIFSPDDPQLRINLIDPQRTGFVIGTEDRSAGQDVAEEHGDEPA